jgi:hypothetical protein
LFQEFHMGIALFTLSSIFAPLHALFSGFVPRQPAGACRHPQASRAAAPRPRMTCAAPRVVHMQSAVRPLRVLRVVEPQTPASCAGRMVISGRMADVCAELDRLAALESSGH